MDPLITQSDGMCIGSKIALFLSAVYSNTLNCVGTKIIEQKGKDKLYISRYVDDVLSSTTQQELSEETRRSLVISCPELTSTSHRLCNMEISLLDLVSSGATWCWVYGKLSRQHLLLLRSCHPKNIKRGTLTTLTKMLLRNLLSNK